MKRFLLFAYDMYYPQGGQQDVIGSYDTLKEANEAHTRFEYLDILDRKEGEWIVPDREV